LGRSAPRLRAVRAPTKGKAEAGVKYVKRNGPAELEFASFAALETHLAEWMGLADQRIHGTTHEAHHARRQEGVFSTRSSDRPNPIGLHDVVITAVEGRRLQVRHLEALNGTPIIDVKPVLSRDIGQP
jgi:tRNA (Thr-GGU) A37 N-methylase